MELDVLQNIAGIAQSITVVTVLLAWLYREIKSRDKLSSEIMEDYKDMKQVRINTMRTKNGQET